MIELINVKGGEKKLKKQLILITLITLFTLIIAGSVSAANNATSESITNDTNESTVILPDPYNTRTGISYTTIQSAIDDPLTLNGDTIEVEPGTYTENVIVNKNLTIIATGPNTIVNGSFTITAAGSGSTIQGFTVNYFVSSNQFSENFDSVSTPGLPSGWAVTDVSGVTGNWATNVGTYHPLGYAAHSGSNVAYFNSWSVGSGNIARLYRTTGLDLSGLSSAQLSFWMFHDTGYVAQADNIQLQISTDGGITWNNVGSAINRYDGTTGWKKHTIDISSYTGNGMNNVQIGFLGVSSFGNDCTIDDIVVSNGVTSEPNGIYVNGASHVTIAENTVNGFTNIGIYVHNYASNNNILNNVVTNNGYGIYLNYYADNNNIQGNTVTNSQYDGITMGASTGNTIKDNLMSNNGRYGFWSNYFGNTITGNTIINNLRGIGLNNYVETIQAEAITFNRIYNNSEYNYINLQPLSHGLPGVNYNWWGSNDPAVFVTKISGIGTFGPWLYMTINATPTTINNGETSLITVSFNNAYDGVTITPFDPATGHIPDGTPVTFTTDLGSIGCETIDKETTGGIATATLTADELAGIAHITGTTDAQTINTEVTINPKSSLYLTVTPDKTNPVVGDTVIYTLKVGNNGPDTATDVVVTYIVPEGLEYAGANVDNGTYAYDAATRTVTWTIGEVPVGDPYMWLSLKILRSGSYLINPQLSTSAFDQTLSNDTQSITIHATAASNNSTNSTNNTVNAASTVSMQNTGVPLAALVLALFMVIGGMVSSKK